MVVFVKLWNKYRFSANKNMIYPIVVLMLMPLLSVGFLYELELDKRVFAWIPRGEDPRVASLWGLALNNVDFDTQIQSTVMELWMDYLREKNTVFYILLAEHDDRRSWHPPHQFTRQILIFIWRSPDFGHNTEEGRTWPA